MAVHTEAGGLAEQITSNPSLAEAVDVGQILLTRGEALLTSLFRTWNLYQVLIAIGLFVVAHLLRAVLGPRVRNWMANRKDWPTWRMRILVVIHQRLRAIFFVALIWAVVLAMRELTWPSRSYLLSVIATLAFAWLFMPEAESLLNSAGFNVGDFRFSLLLLVQAIIILGVLITLARFVTTTTASRIRSNEDISPSMQVLIVKFLQICKRSSRTSCRVLSSCLISRSNPAT